MAKTGEGLAEYARLALNGRWGYCLGTFGQTLTEGVLAQKCAQGGGVGAYNTGHADYLRKQLGRRVSDCYGLVKGYLWSASGGEPAYSAAQDRNQEAAYRAASVKGALETLPETPGAVLWMKGHAGVYLGGGEFIECAGCPVGVRRGAIKNGAVTSGSRFTHWFYDTFIEYPAPVGTVGLRIDGEAFSVPGMMIGGRNYVGARALLERMGYEVGWEGGAVTAKKQAGAAGCV